MMYIYNRLRDIYTNKGFVGVLKGLYRFIKFGVRERPSYIRYSAFRNKTKNRIRGFQPVPDPLAETEIPPHDITDCCDAFEKYGHEGAIRDGRWDQRRTPLTETTKYRGIQQRYVEGYDWEDTAIFEEFTQLIESGDQKDGVNTYDRLVERYEQIDRLYESIKTNGVLRRADRPDASGVYDDILLNIGGDGELLFNGNGWHRLCIAKILDLDSIPVRIYVRHSDWQRVRERVSNGDNPSGVALTHPDLQAII